MPNIYQIASEFRAALVRRDNAALARMIMAFAQVEQSMGRQAKAMAQLIETARAEGVQLSPSWLYRQERYQELQRQAREQLNQYAGTVALEVTARQNAEIDLATKQTIAQLRKLGAETSLNRLPKNAIANLIGFAGDGSPLKALLGQLGTAAAQGIQAKLLEGLAGGKGPAVIAREIQTETNMARYRAMTIARTETLRAHREASRQTAIRMRADRWQWVASKSERTCLACLALDGKVFSIDRPMPFHPNCRCVQIFLLPGAAVVQYETGETWFEKQSDEVKRRMMTGVAFKAYKAGEVSLSDFVGFSESPDWGEMRFERSLKQIRASKGTPPAPPKPTKPDTKAAQPKKNATSAAVAPSARPKTGADARARLAPLQAEVDALTRDLEKQLAEMGEKAKRAMSRDEAIENYLEFNRITKQVQELRAPATQKAIAVLLHDEARAARPVFTLHGTRGAAIPDKINEGVTYFNRLIGEGLIDGEPLTINYANRKGRAYASKNTISIFNNTRMAVVPHELGHVLEEIRPEIHQKILAFYDKRTAGDKLEKLKKITGLNYGPKEVAKRDKWLNAYMGRYYAFGGKQYATEILSMGLEMMIDNPLELATKDPEYFDFIYDLITQR